MFDVGFSELVLVGLVALLVFGPERLPHVAREAALWIRKLREMASSVKAEVDRELQLQELRETLSRERREMEKILHDKPLTPTADPTQTTRRETEGEHE